VGVACVAALLYESSAVRDVAVGAEPSDSPITELVTRDVCAVFTRCLIDFGHAAVRRGGVERAFFVVLPKFVTHVGHVVAAMFDQHLLGCTSVARNAFTLEFH